jgi:hypothetical protein
MPSNSSNVTMDLYPFFLFTTIHANFSIIASCLPFMKPVVEAISPGMIINHVHFGLQPAYSRKRMSKGALNPFAVLGGREFNTGSGSGSRGRSIKDQKSSRSSMFGVRLPTHKEGLDGIELQTQRSRDGSQDRMVIRQTRTIEVSSDSATATNPIPKGGLDFTFE